MFTELTSKLAPFCREQLLCNIVREWCKLASVISPTRVFSIDSYSSSLEGNSKVVTVENVHQNDIETAVNYYTNGISQWVGSGSSFGIIHRYFLRNPHHLNQLSSQSGDSFNRGISLVVFCPKEETRQLQQMLTRMRSHWYRKLSKSPLNSGFNSVLNEESNSVNIFYKPKQLEIDHDIQLEDIILNADERQNYPESCIGNRDIIVCRTNLDNCLTAFLDDAYTVVDENQVVLKLNPAIVPFKLAITFDEGDNISRDTRSKLNEVADYLITSLRDYSDVRIFPFVPQVPLTTKQSDTLAIQYCVVLKEETLKSGVIWLRNRDTRISETMHISNFTKTMLFYLQPEKLINLEEANQSQPSRTKSVPV